MDVAKCSYPWTETNDADQTMDARTIQYYWANATDIADRYESVTSPVSQWFAHAFPPSSRVLDIGSGSGRDLACLLAQGFDAHGIEPCDPLREQSALRHPELRNRLGKGALPDLTACVDQTYDGVLCSAVLMHLPGNELPAAAKAIGAVLNDRGRLLLSLPKTRGDLHADERDINGRLFCAVSPEKIRALFERSGFHLLRRWDTDDALGRNATSWFTLLMELRRSDWQDLN